MIESQLLSYVLRHETPKDPKDKKEKEAEGERDKEQEYQEQHDHLLVALAGAEGDVLDNETLVTMMSQTRIQMSSMLPHISSTGIPVVEPSNVQGILFIYF